MAAKKEQIYEGALTAFSRQEFSETTMDSIAELASVSKGTLYYYFPTKEDLFLDVIEKGIVRLLGQIRPVLESGLSREEMLVKLLKVHLKFFDREKRLCQLLMSKVWGTQTLHHGIQERISHYFSTMEGFFGQLQKEGWIDPAISIPTLTSALFGMVGFTALRRMEMGLAVYTQETKLSLIALCSGALRAEGIVPRSNERAMGERK
ncbi:TetR/AcrR family transcriptional regulator [Paenibacillus sp. J2TS4]|uniref:TetR/AcrR family transcriptional regulator n=1 Tax=Paenibacillus sp. J2TS4 TaxID=2807194 RepID=UPI001B12D04B|nr:TetR/AcrR family transcriptional regulator [Paenibacillus sp. J2TS4]GIP32759.1 TetR family transcriptional regulator [Paenibacillus sp. J2TS4]